VFDDTNRNGYPDTGERGLANVRIVTVNGQIVTTDAEGRFHIACADVPNELRGSNYILKLDPRTLPTGYRMTTENPLSARLTRGKLAKMNFGAAIHRVVRIDVMDAAFPAGGTTLQPRWTTALAQVLPALQTEQSVLRIAYVRAGAEDPRVAEQRVEALIRYFRDGWAQIKGPYELMIETEISGGVTGVGSGQPTSGLLPTPRTGDGKSSLK
jgi:large repetitive protein